MKIKKIIKISLQFKNFYINNHKKGLKLKLFVKDKMNMFDLIIVIASIIEFICYTILNLSSKSKN